MNLTDRAAACLVGPGGVDGPPFFFLVRYRPTGVEVLQGEAERVDHAVAGLARLGSWSEGPSRSRVVSSGWRSAGSGVKASGGGRSARPRTLRARNTPAVDGRARRRCRRTSPSGRDASARRRAAWLQNDLLERCVAGQVGAVEPCQPAVQVQEVRQQELAEIRRLAPDHVFQEQVERSAQVGGDRTDRIPGNRLGSLARSGT